MGGNFKSPYRSLQSWRNWREIVMGGGIPWLLRDEFTDTRAAGAVNGTPATPGPGTRSGKDTGAGLTISAGSAHLSGGGAAADPSLFWTTAFVRQAGRVLILAIINNDGAKRFRFGWDTGINTEIVSGAVQFNHVSGVNVYENAAGISVGAYAAATNYTFSIVLRGTGGYYFVTGGAFTEWTLLWIGAQAADTPLYAGIASTGVNLIDASCDFARIPDELYLPTPLVYDSFTRANGPLGSTEAVGPDGQATTARVWNNRVGTTLIAGNTASASALIGGEAIATVDTGTADVLQGAELTRAGGNVGVVVRYTDAANYVIGYHDGINAKLDKVVAGVTTPVITAAAAYAAGTVLWIICEGTQFSLYYNNVQIGATGTINDASLQNGTEQGLYSTNVGNSQDDMLTMPRGTNGEYDGLNRYGG